MKDNLELTIFTPERNIKVGNVKEVITESLDGRFSILANHVPMITSIKPTITKFINLDGEKKNIFTSSGIVEILNNKVNIICDSSQWPEEIDSKRAELAKERAENRLENKSNIDVKRAKLALCRAMCRLSILK